MDISELLITCLSLQEVTIEKQRCDIKNLLAEFWVRQIREGACCYHCGCPLYGVHQWRQRQLKGPPLGPFNRVIIYFFQLQAACDYCQRVRLAEAPFIHPKYKNLTTAFAECAVRLMEECTGEAVSRLLNHNSKQLWKLDQWRMQQMKKSQGYKNLTERANIRLLSADEVHMRTIKPKKGKYSKVEWSKKFITNLVCYNHSKIIANAAGRDAGSLRRCLDQLTEPQSLAVEYLAVDMHDGYIRAAKERCPNAEIAVDRFHLAEQLNKQFDEVRKAELTKAKQGKDKFQQDMLSGSKRFVLLEREKTDLPKGDYDDLVKLRMLNENINTGLLLVEYFHRLLDRKNIKSFRKGLKKWQGLVKVSGLEPFKKYSRLVTKYIKNIETYIRTHLTTAVSEGLNNKIKVLKRMGYGYTNQESFMNKTLQRCGFLNSTHLDTTSWFWGPPEGLA